MAFRYPTCRACREKDETVQVREVGSFGVVLCAACWIDARRDFEMVGEPDFSMVRLSPAALAAMGRS